MSTAEIAQPFFPPHLKILDHFCHSSEAWRLCASHSIFSPSFPSSLLLKEREKELRSYLGYWSESAVGTESMVSKVQEWLWKPQPLGGCLALESCLAYWWKRCNNCLGEDTNCPSAWNLLLSDSSALGTLKIKRSNSCTKKDLLFECAELHSPETQHWNTLEGRRGSCSSFLLQKGEGRGRESMKLLLPVTHLISMVKF